MALEAHEIEYRPPAVHGTISGAADEAPAQPEAAEPWATILIRGALMTVIFYSTAHLLIGAFTIGTSSWFFELHAAMIALAAAAIGLTWTSLYRKHWRELVFAEASMITIGAMGLSAVGAPSGDFFTQAMMLQVGTAAVVPWGMRWQGGYAVVCAAAAIATASLVPINDPFVVYRWLELGAATGLALFIAALLERYRDSIRRRISVLQASEEQLWKIFDANPDIVTIASYPEGR
ncbi:MAG TPA: hypothetical protein VJ718_10295, partial [Candidatus Binataceae bacterium]|nr:hypothetical protein [Candidatus Binataceae bacterium]